MTTSEMPTSQEPTTVDKLRGLPWSIAGDTANTVFAQWIFFGSVFILFLDKLGLNKTQIGSLLSFIPFAGLVALFIAPAAARFGTKRTFVTFFGIRKVITAGLLLTPWVTSVYGPTVAMIFVAVITAGFALTKAVADTAAYPWVQEYIPDSVRGKYYATSNLFTTLAAFAAVTIAGVVIERIAGLCTHLPAAAACLTMAPDDRVWYHRLRGAWSGLRSRLTNGAYLDQAPLFRRDEALAVGGFHACGAYDSADLGWRLRAHGRFVVVSEPVIMSCREYHQRGFLGATLRHQRLRWRQFRRAAPAENFGRS